jgi:hypothetical protein
VAGSRRHKRFGAIENIWDDPAIRDSLFCYLAVAENKRPANFRIAATLLTQLDPATSVRAETVDLEVNRMSAYAPRAAERRTFHEVAFVP